jgi:hypothetical protein
MGSITSNQCLIVAPVHVHVLYFMAILIMQYLLCRHTLL